MSLSKLTPLVVRKCAIYADVYSDINYHVDGDNKFFVVRLKVC